MKREFIFLSTVLVLAVSLFLLVPSGQVIASESSRGSIGNPCDSKSSGVLAQFIDQSEPLISLPCGSSGFIEISSEDSRTSNMWMSSNYTVEEQREDCESYNYNPPIWQGPAGPYYYQPWYDVYQTIISQVTADCNAKGAAVSVSDVQCGTEICNGQSRGCIPSVSPFTGCPVATVTATPPAYINPAPGSNSGQCSVTYTAHAETEIVASCDTCVIS